MPQSIILSNIAWSTPDGHSLFSDLDLTFGPERTGLIGRNGVGKSTLLRIVTGDIAPSSGSVYRPVKLGVLRQIVQLAEEQTVADLFGARRALDILDRAEAGEASVEDIAEADWTVEARIDAALSDLGLVATTRTPLEALSGGQRTRAMLAALVFNEPDFLILDEPTNNLDREGREAVIRLLSGWRRGAIIVSHDRELLETMDAIVELTTHGAARYGGNWSQYRAQKALELAAAERDLADAEKRVEEVARSAQAVAERKSRKDSAGKRNAARGDLPKILLGGRRERAENTGGTNARLNERLSREAAADAATARERIEVLQPVVVRLSSTGLSSGRTVLSLDNVTAGYNRDRPLIRDFSLSITGPERVGVIGPNGSGKSTLLSLITGRLQPFDGTVAVPVNFALLDQRVDLLDRNETIRVNFRRLNQEADENTCRAALARFMFRADAALKPVSVLSGGEMLRAGLACVLGGATPPPLLILDEPTNHLDIDSIAAVEAGLRAYDGALLVVSHDEVFLENIGITRRIRLGDA